MTRLSLPPDSAFQSVLVSPEPDGGHAVLAFIRSTDVVTEGGKFGLALDASRSIRRLYGIGPNPQIRLRNRMGEMARVTAAYLASLSCQGRCHSLYFALGPTGAGCEIVGSLTEDEASVEPFAGPEELPWGNGTRLMPALSLLLEPGPDGSAPPLGGADCCAAVIVTDGDIDDHAQVAPYSEALADMIARGQRGPVSLVLIGLFDPGRGGLPQIEKLNSLFRPDRLDPRGQPVRVWTAHAAPQPEDVPALVSTALAAPIPVSGRVVEEPTGRVVQTYAREVPPALSFMLSAEAEGFRLEIEANEPIRQAIV